MYNVTHLNYMWVVTCVSAYTSVCVCVYIHMCVYVYIYMHIYTLILYIHIHIYLKTYMHSHYIDNAWKHAKEALMQPKQRKRLIVLPSQWWHCLCRNRCRRTSSTASRGGTPFPTALQQQSLLWQCPWLPILGPHWATDWSDAACEQSSACCSLVIPHTRLIKQALP